MTTISILRCVDPETLPVLKIKIEIKIELNFYFHTSLWCLKRFYEGLKGINLIFCFSREGLTLLLLLFCRPNDPK